MFSRLSLVASVLAASLAIASPLASRAAKPACVPTTGIDAPCKNLVSACLSAVSGGNGAQNQLWHQKSCVAAATCYGVGNLVDKVSCQVGTAVTNKAQVSLDYNIYAGIVGDCAWSSTGCPIREQWYIDFYYGTLTDIKSNAWPADSKPVVAQYWKIVAWTSTGETIPYLNFNDWLHYSTYPTGGATSSPVPTTVIPTTTVAPSLSLSVTPTILPTSTAAPNATTF